MQRGVPAPLDRPPLVNSIPVARERGGADRDTSHFQGLEESNKAPEALKCAPGGVPRDLSRHTRRSVSLLSRQDPDTWHTGGLSTTVVRANERVKAVVE
ncbi:hypothetical protein ACLOJK_032862 [Asimina triloba]